ncbi:hypothetical protein [Staphylococcus sp. 11261D007BR]
MKKIIMLITVASLIFILGACSSDADEQQSQNKPQNDSKSSQKEEKKTPKLKETTFSELFNDGETHLVYYFKDSIGYDLGGNDLENNFKQIAKEPERIEGIYNVKNNQGFRYNFNPQGGFSQNSIEDLTLDKLAQNSVETNHRKFEKFQQMNLDEYNEGLIESDISPSKINNEPKAIKKTYYTKNNHLISENYSVAFNTIKQNDPLSDEPKYTWDQQDERMVHYFTNFPINQQVPFGPYTINGKTFAGIAEKNNSNYSNVLITEVPKNTKIILDKDTDDGNIERYEDTDEYKRKKKEEAKNFDNL